MGHFGNTAMSAEFERIFSSAARLVTTLWNGLKKDSIEANGCLKAWLPRRERTEKLRAGRGQSRRRVRVEGEGASSLESWEEF